MKRPDLLHAVLARLRDAIRREGLACETGGAELTAPGEYLVTVLGGPADEARLAAALGPRDGLYQAQVIEDVGETNRRLHGRPDADRRRHLHLAVSAPTLG
jgi:hypothetical protein